jgi:DNA repair protein RadC
MEDAFDSQAMILANTLLRQISGAQEEAEMEHAFFHFFENCPETFLNNFPAIDPMGRARLATAFELGKRYGYFRKKRATRSLNRNPAQQAIGRIGSSLRLASYEWLGFVPLYKNGEVGNFNQVEKGVRTHVNVEPAELFAKVLALRPKGFFLFHNHPAGTLEPSPPDLNLTDRVSQIAHQLGTPLLGHYIITSEAEILI